MDNLTETEHYSEKSDISCSMNRLIDDENPASPTEEDSPSKSSDSLDEKSRTIDLEEDMGFDKETMEIPKSNDYTNLKVHVIIYYFLKK